MVSHYKLKNGAQGIENRQRVNIYLQYKRMITAQI